MRKELLTWRLTGELDLLNRVSMARTSITRSVGMPEETPTPVRRPQEAGEKVHQIADSVGGDLPHDGVVDGHVAVDQRVAKGNDPRQIFDL